MGRAWARTAVVVATIGFALSVQRSSPAHAIQLSADVCASEASIKHDFLGRKYADQHFVELFDGRFVCGYDNTAYANVIGGYRHALELAANANQDPPPLVLHFHGGLVSGYASFSNSTYDYDAYTDNAKAYPIFFVWHSGPSDTGVPELLPQTGHITTPHGLFDRWDFIRSRSLERLSDDTDHTDLTEAEWQHIKPNPSATVPPENVATREEQLRLENLLNGSNMWHHMKNEIEDSFAQYPDRGGFRLVRDLARIADWWPGPRPPRIILVGHSMGSIYASRFVEAYRAYTNDAAKTSKSRDLKFDLVFLAPAVTYDDFARAIATGIVQNFRMFTMYDYCERLDHVAKAVLQTTPLSAYGDWYPRSLLYYVSSTTEPYPDIPLLGLARFLDPAAVPGDPLLQSVRKWMTISPRAIVLSPTNTNVQGSVAPGFESTAVSHGDFDTDPGILRSIQHIIEKGFGPADTTKASQRLELRQDPLPNCLRNTPSYHPRAPN